MKIIVEIPQYVRKVQMSNSQRPKYFEWNGIEIKCKGVKLPRKYFENPLENEAIIEKLKVTYFLGEFKTNKFTGKVVINTDDIDSSYKLKYRLGIYVDDKFEPIVANPTKVGTPKMYLINGQDIHNGHLQNHMLGFVMNKIKECYYPYIKDLKPIDFYPVKIRCEVHDTIKHAYVKAKSDIGQRWDVDNLVYPYLKAFPDILTREGILKDDDRLHLPSSIHAEFYPIDNHSERKLVFIIEKDEREVLKTNKLFCEFHKTKDEDNNTYESEDLDLVKDENDLLDWEVKNLKENEDDTTI